LTLKPASVTGVDISAEMIEVAKSHLPPEVKLVKTDGTSLPFEDRTFDYVFTATVLQHNTQEDMLMDLVAEICRVAKEKVYFFERIEDTVLGDELCYGRPVSYYAALCRQHGFELVSTKFINIRTSYYVSGTIRKGLNSKSRREGEPLNGMSVFLQKATLPITRQLDKLFPSKKDVARLEFKRVGE